MNSLEVIGIGHFVRGEGVVILIFLFRSDRRLAVLMTSSYNHTNVWFSADLELSCNLEMSKRSGDFRTVLSRFIIVSVWFFSGTRGTKMSSVMQ